MNNVLLMPTKQFGSLNAQAIKACLKVHKSLVIGTENQKELIERLRVDFPTNLIEIVGTTGVRIYE